MLNRPSACAGLVAALLLSSACSPTPLRLDFEDEHFPGEVNGRVQRQSAEAHGEGYALEVIGEGGGYNHQALDLMLDAWPTLQRAQYGRIMVKLDPATGRSGDFTLVQAEGPATQASGAPPGTRAIYRVRIDGRSDHLMANYETLNPPGVGGTNWLTDCWNQPPTVDPAPPAYRLQPGAWQCVQWHFDAATNSARYWLNGQALPEIDSYGRGDGCIGPDTQNGAWLAPERFARLWFGIEQYHPKAAPRRIWIDDIVVSDEPVACGEAKR